MPKLAGVAVCHFKAVRYIQPLVAAAVRDRDIPPRQVGAKNMTLSSKTNAATTQQIRKKTHHRSLELMNVPALWHRTVYVSLLLWNKLPSTSRLLRARSSPSSAPSTSTG